MDGMRHLPRISVDIYGLIVKVMIAISACPLNYIQLHKINDFRNLHVLFGGFFWGGVRLSSLHVSWERNQTKVPESWSKPMQILDSSLNMTFIQLSTRQECFSLVHLNLIFSVSVKRKQKKCWFSFGFRLSKFDFIQSISCSSVTNIDSCYSSFISLFVSLYIFYFQGILLRFFYHDSLISFKLHLYVFLF